MERLVHGLTTQTLEALNLAPAYQPIRPTAYDPPQLREYLTARNAMCRRKTAERITCMKPSDLIRKSVLDIGCEVGAFGFALAHAVERYVGMDTDTRCVHAADSLLALRQYIAPAVLPLSFEECSIVAPWRRRGLIEQGFDTVFYLSVHHHIIGTFGIETARRILADVGRMAPVLYFEMGQVNEQRTEGRAYWHDALPDDSPFEFMERELTRYGGYQSVTCLGRTYVSGELKRLLLRAKQ